MQLTTLAKSRGKSPYHLLQPYMAKVAPFIVSRLVTEPHMLRETCQLLTMGAAGFLSLTLLHTLPGLFAACNRPVVDKIAVTIGETPSALLLKQVHEVLAHAYLLPDPQRTTSALQFVVETLAIDAGNDQIQLDILIKSCAVNLLTPLVIATGDDRPERQAAVSMLELDPRSLLTSSNRRSGPLKGSPTLSHCAPRPGKERGRLLGLSSSNTCVGSSPTSRKRFRTSEESKLPSPNVPSCVPSHG
jgi:serine/threonine-protein kinase ATR